MAKYVGHGFRVPYLSIKTRKVTSYDGVVHGVRGRLIADVTGARLHEPLLPLQNSMFLAKSESSGELNRKEDVSSSY